MPQTVRSWQWFITVNLPLKCVDWDQRYSTYFLLASKVHHERTSLVTQWLRIHLPMQETWVWSLVWEDPTCHRATKPMHHNYWACNLEPVNHNYWDRVPQLLKPMCPRAHVPQLLSLCAATTEARMPRAHALQQEKPLQWEASTPQRRVALTHCN